MLSEVAVIEINNLLTLSDSYRMSQFEIDVLNKTGADPQTECEYYDTAQIVLTDRSKTDTTQNNSLEQLQILANIDGCTITLETAIVPSVDIPVFGGMVE
jgi:hypothetical protein